MKNMMDWCLLYVLVIEGDVGDTVADQGVGQDHVCLELAKSSNAVCREIPSSPVHLVAAGFTVSERTVVMSIYKL